MLKFEEVVFQVFPACLMQNKANLGSLVSGLKIRKVRITFYSSFDFHSRPKLLKQQTSGLTKFVKLKRGYLAFDCYSTIKLTLAVRLN